MLSIASTGITNHASALGEALFAWGSSEPEVGEVLGGLGVDDYAVAGEWVAPSQRRLGNPTLAKNARVGHPPVYGGDLFGSSKEAPETACAAQ